MPKQKRFFIVLLILCLAFAFTACGGSAEEADEPADEGVSNVDIDTSLDGESGTITSDEGSLEYGENIDWPADVPLDEVNATLVGVAKDDATGQYTIVFNEMEADDAAAYVQYLKDEGFVDGMEMSDADMITYSGTNANNEFAAFLYTNEPKEGSLTYLPDMAAVE